MFLTRIFRPVAVLKGKTMATQKKDSQLLEAVRQKLIPDFSDKCFDRKLYKGVAGRVGVVGGCKEYTGAPYFSAMCALRVGCDLAHVFCMTAAAPVIKGYSPDLIVHPLLDYNGPDFASMIEPWLPRLHTIVIGPGLGREPEILERASCFVELCRTASKPLVIDADGLWLATLNPKVFRNYPAPLVMTPNKVEFDRLVDALDTENSAVQVAQAFGPNTVMVIKGPEDTIGDAKGNLFSCTNVGSWRRCGGQGDLLSGSLATFLRWEILQQESGYHDYQTGVLAAFAACNLTRESNRRVFEKYGRSMCTSDMLNEIGATFQAIYEHKP